MTSAPIHAEPLPGAGSPHSAQQERRRRYLAALAFIAPAAFFLIVWTVYPTIYTIARSFFSDTAGFSKFVGIDNYKHMFQEPVIRTAVKNNAIWIAVVPAAVTFLGLIFAVLTERIAWATAFKVVVFAPLAISLFATGVMWRVMYQRDPSAGAVNGAIRAVENVFSKPGVLTGAQPSSQALQAQGGGIVLKKPVQAGGTALLGLTAIPATDVPADAKQAATPQSHGGAVVGTVWRDFKPGGGKPGKVESQEMGIPGVTLVLRDASSGKKIGSTTSNPDGSFTFDNVGSGSYQVAIGASTFAKGFQGINWLGSALITFSIIVAYLWASAGFAMVVIGAGLASIPRDVLEAARTDGASEFQVFRRVTVPLLAPVLTVVFVTQIIGVLKLFDIVYSISPGSSINSSTLLAYEMYRRSFTENAFGLGSAIATFILILVVPILALRIRDFRREVQ